MDNSSGTKSATIAIRTITTVAMQLVNSKTDTVARCLVRFALRFVETHRLEVEKAVTTAMRIVGTAARTFAL
jgi:hypothetical protein